MAVANLANTPSNEAELATWSFSHMAHHRDLVEAVYRLTGVRVPLFALDPIDPSDPGSWLDQHQTMHNDIDALLGTPGFDLLGVEWNDTGEREAWIRLNFQSHYAQAEASGAW